MMFSTRQLYVWQTVHIAHLYDDEPTVPLHKGKHSSGAKVTRGRIK